MPYSATHAAQTRGRIVDAARQLFNRGGFDEVTIEQIMAEAGLTRGGFYHHFKDKESLFVEVVATFSRCSRFAAEIAANPSMTADPQAMARSLVDLYLSDEVFDNPDLHCPLYALPTDSIRNGKAARAAYTGLVSGIMAVLQKAIAGHPEAAQRARAIVAMCVGGMVLARTTEDAGLRSDLRAAARAQALQLLVV